MALSSKETSVLDTKKIVPPLPSARRLRATGNIEKIKDDRPPLNSARVLKKDASKTTLTNDQKSDNTSVKTPSRLKGIRKPISQQQNLDHKEINKRLETLKKKKAEAMKPPTIDMSKMPKSYADRMKNKPISQVKADQAFQSNLRTPRVQQRAGSVNSSSAMDHSGVTTRKMRVYTKKDDASIYGSIENTFAAEDTIL